MTGVLSPGVPLSLQFNVQRVGNNAGTPRTYEFTSQFFFDETLTDTVHAQAPCSARGRRNVVNTTDGIYDGLSAAARAALTLQTAPAASGYAGIISLGVNIG